MIFIYANKEYLYIYIFEIFYHFHYIILKIKKFKKHRFLSNVLLQFNFMSEI